MELQFRGRKRVVSSCSKDRPSEQSRRTAQSGITPEKFSMFYHSLIRLYSRVFAEKTDGSLVVIQRLPSDNKQRSSRRDKHRFEIIDVLRKFKIS